MPRELAAVKDVPNAFKDQMPKFALGSLRTVLGLSEEHRLDPAAAVGDALAIGCFCGRVRRRPLSRSRRRSREQNRPPSSQLATGVRGWMA
jgi:hypothetical protein